MPIFFGHFIIFQCLKESIGITLFSALFKSKDIVVIGISKDSVASHIKFAEKYNLPFILISDKELVAIKAYDVWQEKKMCGKVGMGVVRTTYIIDEKGYIEKVMEKVKPDTNAKEILEYLA